MKTNKNLAMSVQAIGLSTDKGKGFCLIARYDSHGLCPHLTPDTHNDAGSRVYFSCVISLVIVISLLSYLTVVRIVRVTLDIPIFV